MAGMCWLDNGVVGEANLGPMFVGCRFFKIMSSLSQI